MLKLRWSGFGHLGHIYASDERKKCYCGTKFFCLVTLVFKGYRVPPIYCQNLTSRHLFSFDDIRPQTLGIDCSVNHKYLS